MTHDTIKSVVTYINLDTLGGSETLFRDYLKSTKSSHISQIILLGTARIHSHIKSEVETLAETLHREKYYRGIKIPKWPMLLRRANVDYFFKSINQSTCVFWNKIEPELGAIARKRNHKIVYFEHGAAWRSKYDKMAKMLTQTDKVVCNSNAAKALICHRWRNNHFSIHAMPLPLSPRFERLAAVAKTFPQGRPVRLGTVGRLEDVKGLNIAIHCVKILRDSGMECNLYLAGTGKREKHLQQLAQNIGVAKHVIFVGLIKDMPQFYNSLDLLIVPSLREPFGLVCLEASSLGCPIVATNVDGLGESVSHGHSGILIQQTMTLEEYTEFGGLTEDIPELVYFPADDRIGRPMAADPKIVSSAVENIFQNSIYYEKMSRNAIMWSRANFSSSVYFRSLNELFLGIRSDKDSQKFKKNAH
jgi:glycosyltransferase involved in cell wall biosynthesis